MSVDIVRRGGNLTVTYRQSWPDGCEVTSRTRTTYSEARIVDRNAHAMACPLHKN